MPITASLYYCTNYRMLKTRSIYHPDHNEKSAAGVTFAAQKQEASRRKSVMHLRLLVNHTALSKFQIRHLYVPRNFAKNWHMRASISEYYNFICQSPKKKTA